MKAIRCLVFACALLLTLIHVDARPVIAQQQEDPAQFLEYPEPNISTWVALGNDVAQIQHNPDGTLAVSVNTEAATYVQQEVQQSDVSGRDDNHMVSTDSNVGSSCGTGNGRANDAVVGDNANNAILSGAADAVAARGGDKATLGDNVVGRNPPDLGLPYVETEEGGPNPVSDLGSPGWQREHMLTQLAAQGEIYIWFWGTEGNDLILIHQNGDGSLTVSLNGRRTSFSQEEVQDHVIAGGAGNDVITADDSVTCNLMIDAGEGNDRVFSGRGDDQILGGSGDDYIDAGAGNDSVDGGNGNNVILGGKGDDNLFGGPSDDFIYGGEGSDYIDAGDGNDTIFGNNGDDQLVGGSGNDVINAGDGNNWVDGCSGNDLIHGGSGNDVIRGGDGNDVLIGGYGRDYLEGGRGDDHLDGGPGDDVMYGLDGNDLMSGGTGNDYMDGGSGDDYISGNQGNNILFGGSGNDQLHGGGGNDLLAGGHGIDSYAGSHGSRVYAQSDDRGIFGAGVVIVDLSTTNSLGSEPGSTIAIIGDADFQMRVDSDLEALLSVPIGRSMLTAIDDSSRVVDISQGWSGNFINFDNFHAAFLNSDGTKGLGSGSHIYYNTTKGNIYDGSLDWQRRPPIVGLYHEMVHAYNGGTGTLQPGYNSIWVPNLEQQALGLPFDGIPFDNDNNPATPPSVNNLTIFTENGMRSFLGLPLRPLY